MRNTLIYLTLSSMVVVALSFGLSSLGVAVAGHTSLLGVRLPGDLMAFSCGALFGLISVWLCMVPWTRVPDIILHILVTWRRNLVLATLATACAGVLLFY